MADKTGRLDVGFDAVLIWKEEDLFSINTLPH
jgi:hypothetical protein